MNDITQTSNQTESTNSDVTPLADVLRMLCADQELVRRAFSLVPSENIMSPLARLPLVLDGYSRYFFDHLSKFGSWSFYGGINQGAIEQRILGPLLSQLASASYTNVQPLSGLSCMTVAMSALTKPGDTILTVPESAGGHMSTAEVARRLGLQCEFLPVFKYNVDLEALALVLRRTRPSLVYIDQSTQLFPFDPKPLRTLIDAESPETLLHFDSSHINGLILAGVHNNPLDRGAHTFGGSTHKTLAGPHKGFLATRDDALAKRIDAASGALVSHHQPAAVASLAITLLELRDCGGKEYANRILENARLLGEVLHNRGVFVHAADSNFTRCHQIWAESGQPDGGVKLGSRLYEAGVMLNRVSVPGSPGTSLRLSVAEFTRLGAEAQDIVELGSILADAILEGAPPEKLRPRVLSLRAKLSRPHYCFNPFELPSDLPDWLLEIATAIGTLATTPKLNDSIGGRH